MPHFQKKMDLKLSVGVRYDAICIERLSQNRRTDRKGYFKVPHIVLIQRLGYEKKMQPKFEAAVRMHP